MFLHETRAYPPLYTLPRWRARWRRRHIIAVRKKGAPPRIPFGLWLLGWKAGTPEHPDRFHCSRLVTTRYSVRGTPMTIDIYRLKGSAVDEVLRGC